MSITSSPKCSILSLQSSDMDTSKEGSQNPPDTSKEGSQDPHEHQPPPPNAIDVGEDKGEDVGEDDDETAFQRKKRAKTSDVWKDFKIVETKNGEFGECLHCKVQYKLNTSRTTTSLNRHLPKCIPKLLADKKAKQEKQQMIAFAPVDVNSLIEPALHNGQFDMAKMREGAAHWITMHEHPFTIVEEEGFNIMQRRGMPEWQRISRAASKNDCVKVFEIEKKKLKNLLKSVNKISLTTDLWKSKVQKIEYMVITGHWIDSNWRLQKRVLNFVHLPPPHRGLEISDSLFKCCKEWGIESKIFTISVDNASNNDVAIRYMKDSFSRNKSLLGGGQLFHVRCCAHILNIMVQGGIDQIEGIIANVRASMEYMNRSEARLMMFAEIKQQLKLPGNKLIRDSKTRWNSTYDMLSCALKFREVFPRFADREPSYDCCPTEEDWGKIEKVCFVLKPFCTVTHIISGSDYPTANLFWNEVCKIKELLDNHAFSPDSFIRDMVVKMKKK